MMMTLKMKVAAGLLATSAVAAGGLAFAAWTADGSGSGQAASLTAEVVTVDATAGSADLYPGFNNGDVYFTLTNDNPYPITFDEMISGTVTSSDPLACPSSNVTIDNGATGLSLSVGANDTSGTLSIADVVNMSDGAPDGCQGKTFNIVLTLSGNQD